MIRIPDPSEFMPLPEWQALHRESMLAQGLMCSAANAIGRAGYADNLGEYYTAFFGFSLGIERLAKLCIVTDHALHHNGKLPSPKVVSSHAHKIEGLVDEVKALLTKNNLRPRYSFPDLPVCQSIIACLHSFAEAREGRYANFDALGGASYDPTLEPINKWWTDVASPILAQHFHGTAVQARAKQNAAMMQAVLGPNAYVAHTDENGQIMSDLEAASYRTAEMKIVQKFGRYYTLLVVRWLASAFKQLAWKASLDAQMVAFFGHWELFYTFTTDDHFLRDRKVWPLR